MLAPLTIEQFKDRFFLERCPFWFAKHATAKGESAGRFHEDELTEGASEEDKLEYSWMQFEALIDVHDYGKLKVVLKKSENANTDKSANYTIEWGNVPSRGRRSSSTASQGGMNGGNWGMMQWFLQEQSKSTNQMMQLQMENMRLNFENQQLAQEQEVRNAPSIQEDLLREGVGIVKTWVASSNMRQPAALGTLGQRTTTQPIQQNQQQMTTEQSNQNVNFTIDGAIQHVRAITDLFPEYDRMTVLEAFYNLALQNKELIGMQLKGVIDGQQ